MALTTFVAVDPNSDPSTSTAIDTGVGSAPAARPGVFNPTGTTATSPAPTLISDYGQGSQAASRVQVKSNPQTVTVSIDPGLGVNG